MSYYLRAFCTDDAPPLRTVVSWAAEQGLHLEGSSDDFDNPDWDQAEIVFGADRRSLVVERSTAEFLAEEVEEFLELLDEVDDSAEKQAVTRHLAQSKCVVAVQLLNDPDGEGVTAAGTFLNFFVSHCGGLVQADGEGFYKANQLIVPLG